MKTRKPHLFPTLYAAHARLRWARRALRARLGVSHALTVLPYRGFGTPSRAVVRGRVLEDRHRASIRVPMTRLEAVLMTYRRFATREVGGAEVLVRWGDREFLGQTDEEGFLDLWVEPPAGTSQGWHDVELELHSGWSRQRRARAPVLIVGRDAALGVISDIDDTVLDSGVQDLFRRAAMLFLSDVTERRPFDGVTTLYRSLREGVDGARANPIFYVSSSPANLHEHIEALFARHGVPAGPLMLRDWGLSRTGFAPGFGHAHKREKIRLVLETFPNLPFLLLGDSGQEDAEHYLEIAREFRGRILCIYIREVTGRDRQNAVIEQSVAEARAAGTELLVHATAEEVQRHAATRGWIKF